MDCVKIDMETFPRRQHFDYFMSLPHPHAGLTCEVDVTEFVQCCKKNKYSFYLMMTHAVALAADRVKEFRQRIREGGIVEYSHCPTSHVELLEDDTYCYCALHHDMPLQEYVAYAEEQRRYCRENPNIEDTEETESCYFISCVPWLYYTDVIQPVRGTEDSNPRFVWGKYREDHHGRLQLPVSVLVHHGLADGVHMARFYQHLEQVLRELSC